MQKQCNKCLITKPILDFVPSKNCKDGTTNTCKICRKIQRDAWRKANPERHYANWSLKNKDKVVEIKKTFYKKHPKYNKKYKLKPTKRQPIWADLEAIRLFYANCPEGYHVDHIIPLRGKLVSGLHVLENLQYLPATDNIKKGNKYAIPD